MDNPSPPVMGEESATVQQIKKQIEKVKRRLHYLEQYAPEKLEFVLAEVNELRRLLAS